MAGMRRLVAIGSALVLGAFSAEAVAQFHAPTPLEEMDDQPRKKRSKAKPEAEDPNEGLPTDTGPDEDASPPPPRAPKPAVAPEVAEPPAPHRGRAQAPQFVPAPPDAGGAAPDGGAADAGALAALAPPILLTSATDQTVASAWEARRRALANRNTKAAREAEATIQGARDDLGIQDLYSIADALDHEAEAQRLARDNAEAQRLATLATQLAPDSPASWASLGHIRLRTSLLDVGGIVGALREAVVRELQQPGPRRALVGDLAASLLLALGLTGFLALLAMVARYLRYAVHDFHHLFPRGALPVQTALLFGVVLALPWALRAGPYAELVLLAALVFAYLSAAERAMITAILAILGFAPYAAGWIARASTFSGTEAEEIWQVSQGGPDAHQAVRHMQAQDAVGKADLPMLEALGLNSKRNGSFDEALGYLRRALILKPNSADALNNLGNVLVLKGDLEGAKDAYLKATETAPDNAVMQFNLAQVSTRRAQLGSKDAAEDIERSKTAMAAVYRLDRTVADHPKDYRATHFVLDVPLSELPQVPEALRAQAEVETQLRTWLMGAMAPELGMILPLGVVLLLWAMAFGFRAVQICSECTRCGRPVCMRCDPDVKGGQLCGQCVFVFARKNVVDAPTRLRKESSARAYQERQATLRKTGSYLIAGFGHLLSGQPVAGTAFLMGTLFFGAVALIGPGVFRAPHADAWGMEGQVLAALLGLGVWLLSIRSHRSMEAR